MWDELHDPRACSHKRSRASAAHLRYSEHQGLTLHAAELCRFVLWDCLRRRSAAQDMLGAQALWAAGVSCAVGLLFLIAAGYFIVSGAKGIALQFGVGEFVIGATVVAVGTSVPELATAIIAKLRGHDEVGLGTFLEATYSTGCSSWQWPPSFIRSVSVGAECSARLPAALPLCSAVTHPAQDSSSDAADSCC